MSTLNPLASPEIEKSKELHARFVAAMLSAPRRPRSFVDEDEMLDRAFRAYFRAARRKGYRADQPSTYGSYVEEDHKGRPLAILCNCRGELARYAWTGTRLQPMPLKA